MKFISRLIYGLFTTGGLLMVLTLSIGIWMIHSLTGYLVNVWHITFYLFQTGGWSVLAGAFGIFLVWLAEVKVVKGWWKRWLVHVVLFAVAAVPVYFWWNYQMLEIMVASVEDLHLRKISIEQTLKLLGLCAALFVPSIALSGGFKLSPYFERAQLYQVLLWIGLCVGLAVPINQFWWLVAMPIQPFADRSIIPYGGSFHEAVKLVAGANGLRLAMILWKSKKAFVQRR